MESKKAKATAAPHTDKAVIKGGSDNAIILGVSPTNLHTYAVLIYMPISSSI